MPLRSCEQALRPGLHYSGLTFASFFPVFGIKSKDSHRIDERVDGTVVFRQNFDPGESITIKGEKWQMGTLRYIDVIADFRLRVAC